MGGFNADTFNPFGEGQFFSSSGGQRPISKPAAAEQQIMDAYGKYLPQIAQLNTAQSQQQIPSLNALNQTQLTKFGLPAAQVGQQIASSNAAAGAKSNVDLLTGAGGNAARFGQSLNQELNPNYYKTLSAASEGARAGINAINLTGLSPGESNAVERSLNQTNTASGNLGLINPTNTISNAMNFGGAFNSKLGLMNNAVNTATGVAGVASGNAGYSPVGTALGTSQTNQGTTFVSPQMTQTTNPSNLGPTLFSGLTGVTNTYQPLSEKQNYEMSPGQISNQKWSAMGNLCCFIFLEATNGKLPWYVRAERDKYYSQEPRIATGYKKMAQWLVPMMQSNKTVKLLVNIFMVKPITYYGGWLHKVNKFGFICKPFKSAWFTIWKRI